MVRIACIQTINGLGRWRKSFNSASLGQSGRARGGPFGCATIESTEAAQRRRLPMSLPDSPSPDSRPVASPATLPVELAARAANAHERQHIERTVLDNGLTIVSETMRHVRSVTMGIWMLNGSRRESAEHNGITHFIEHMVFKGTRNRTAEQIARSVDSIGGNLDAFTSKENVCFSAKVLDEHVPLAFEVLADLVLNPLFREEDIAREQGVILQEIKMDEDNPDYLVHEIFTQNFWKDHPLGRPILGTTETVKRLRQDLLLEYYRACFAP